jgi:hypothetical protein
MKNILFLTIAIYITTISFNYGQLAPVEKGLQAINQDAIKAQLGFLASDWTEGRMAGEKGELISSDYIAGILQLYGVKPGGDKYEVQYQGKNISGNVRSYFQNFIIQKTVAGDEQILKLKSSDGITVKTTNFTFNFDFTLKPSDPDIEIEAPVVFVGYGFVSSKMKYNDFSKSDLKGKFILKIAGIPKFIRESLSPSEIESAAREMEVMIKSMGSIGMIEFNPLTTVIGNRYRNEAVNMSPSEKNPRSGMPNARYSLPSKNRPDNLIRIEVTVKTANEILKGTGINLEDYIKKSDINEPLSIPPVTGKLLYLKTTVKTTPVAVRNVIGVIEGNNPEQIIVLGAHYDHMGTGNGYIWNGADDNGSGTVGIMTIARAIMETGKKPDKTIIIALWTAEEEGLLGSKYYVENITCPLKNLKLNLNLDMISRYISDTEPKKVTMTYTSSCTGFKDMTIANIRKHDIDLIIDYQPSDSPPGGTDHRSFVAAGIPVMRFKPGHRDEYHTPKDELDTVDWDIMEKIIRISFVNVWELANSSW